MKEDDQEGCRCLGWWCDDDDDVLWIAVVQKHQKMKIIKTKESYFFSKTQTISKSQKIHKFSNIQKINKH